MPRCSKPAPSSAWLHLAMSAADGTPTGTCIQKTRSYPKILAILPMWLTGALLMHLRQSQPISEM